MIRIVVADEHEVVRVGLKTILAGSPDLEVVGETSTACETMRRVREGRVDVLIMELLSDGRGGVDLIRQIKQECPQLPVLVLTTHRELDCANRTIKAGAAGYLTKASAAHQIVEAVRKIAAGRHYISEELGEYFATQLADDISGLSGHKLLTSREYEIFLRLADGQTCTVIAQSLSLNVKTISSHKAHLMDKMKLSSLSELVQYAVAHKLVVQYAI